MAVAGDSGLSEPRLADREGIEPPNVAFFVVRLLGLLISALPFKPLSDPLRSFPPSSQVSVRLTSAVPLWLGQASNLQPPPSDGGALPA